MSQTELRRMSYSGNQTSDGFAKAIVQTARQHCLPKSPL
jgi:hypothetical protein